MGEPVQYLEILGWDAHLHPDTTRKVSPPFRWLKLPTDQLDVLGDLTLREYGAYVRLLLLAATTNNRTRYRPGWIRRRTGVSRQAIETLSDRNLVRIVSIPERTEKIEADQGTKPSDASVLRATLQQAAGPEGEGRERGIRGEAPLAKSEPDPAPSRPVVPPDKRVADRRDTRTFDELKAAVLPVARKFRTSDPDELQRLAGQSLRMTVGQTREALKQLREDGELT